MQFFTLEMGDFTSDRLEKLEAQRERQLRIGVTQKLLITLTKWLKTNSISKANSKIKDNYLAQRGFNSSPSFYILFR